MEVAGSEREIPCELALLAMGFVHPQHEGLVEELGVELDERGNVKASEKAFQTNIPKIFTAGDMRGGQSLVVWAISEGRECARKVDEYIMGFSRREFNYGVNLGYELLEGLTANFRLAQQNNTASTRTYYPTTSLFRGNATSPIRKGRADLFNSDSDFKLYEAYLTNTNQFGNTNLTLTAGYSFQQSNYFGNSMSIGDFPDNDIDFINNIETSQDLQNAGFITVNSDASPDEKIIASSVGPIFHLTMPSSSMLL